MKNETQHVYTLDEEIREDRFIPVDKKIYTKFVELVDEYVHKEGLLDQLEQLRKDISSAKDEETFDDFIDKYTELKNRKMLQIKEKALDQSSFFLSNKKGYGIYQLKIIKKGRAPIYFRDIFDKKLGAEITDINQTAEMGHGMGMRSDTDDFEMIIENTRKKIQCKIEWSW